MERLPIIVSRIVTCFEQWHYLLYWLDNDALYLNGVEWIIINDDPKTPTPPEAEEIATRRGITILTPRTNLGRCNARNLGARKARGIWLDLIDGDDMPLRLEPQAFDSITTDLVGCPILQYKLGHEAETPIADPPTKEIKDILPFGPDHITTLMFPGYMPADPRPASMVYRRNSFLELGGYDARYDDGWNDAEFLARAYLNGLTLHRIQRCKQAYLRNAPNKPKRIHALSIYKLFSMLEVHGEPQHRQEFRRQKQFYFRAVFWQALSLGNACGLLSWPFRLRTTLQVLRIRPVDR